MKRQRNTTKIKEQTRNTEVQINEEEIGKLPEKEFRIMIVKMIKNLESKMGKYRNQLTKTQKNSRINIQRKQHNFTEIKNTLEGINSRISEAEE